MASAQVSQQLAGVILSSKELGSMESASRLVGQEDLKETAGDAEPVPEQDGGVNEVDIDQD